MAMAKSNSFKESNEKTKIAEYLVATYLSSLGWAFIFVCDNPKYQAMGIDIICINRRTGEKITIEVKSDDRSDTPNFFFETVSNVKKGSTGWSFSTQAQYVIIFYPLIHTIYILDGQELVAWFCVNHDRQNKYGRNEFFEITNATKSYDGSDLYKSKGRLINREIFRREVGFIDKVIVPDYLITAALAAQ